MSRLVFSGLTDTGRLRKENQDKWLADEQLGLFLVADGMGGAFAGELASRIVVETLPLALRKKLRRHSRARCHLAPQSLSSPKVQECLRDVLAGISNALRAQSQDQPGLHGMGATVVLALIRGTQALLAHLGDSRCYLLRGGKLECLTKDHTLVQLLLDTGEIKPDEAATHPARHKLTRFVGMPDEAQPDVRPVELAPGDTLLLCSDGLHGMLGDTELLAILTASRNPEESCRRLVAAANAAGGKDNIAVLVVGTSAGDKALPKATSGSAT